MIYRYSELLSSENYITNAKIMNLVKNKKIFKLKYGLYSDKTKVPELELVAKKYEKAIFTSDSAFFYHGLTDNIPKKYYFATKKRARKIKDEKVVQTFMEDKYFPIGDSFVYYNNIKIRIYDKERMLIELVRNKNNIPYDMYKEIINNYRNIISELNLLKLQEYLSHFTNKDKLLKIIEEEVL